VPIRDDDRNVSAREWRAVREGETHAATKTSSNNTPESFIVGIGASGALLACAALVFVTLVGLVSFNVWPTAHSVSVDGNVELSSPTPTGSSAGGAATPVGAAAGQVASTSVGVGSGAGNGGTTGGNDQGAGGKGGQPKGGVTIPPSTSPTPPPVDNSGSSGGSDTNTPPGTASKSPTHPVHPTHPDTPHQNVSDGTHGKDNGSSDDDGSDDVVTGKGPFHKPGTPPSSSSNNSDGSNSGDGSSATSRGRGSGRGRH
jgi:hypothetical protein